VQLAAAQEGLSFHGVIYLAILGKRERGNIVAPFGLRLFVEKWSRRFVAFHGRAEVKKMDESYVYEVTMNTLEHGTGPSSFIEARNEVSGRREQTDIFSAKMRRTDIFSMCLYQYIEILWLGCCY
jgi:hypothetical protein